MKKYDNYAANLEVLSRAGEEDLTNEFIVSGIIDKFFVQFELGWKLLKELLQYEGKAAAATGSPRSIIKAAYAVYDFVEEEVWLDMLQDRNDMAHMYNGAAAMDLADRILKEYISEFQHLQKGLEEYYGDILTKP